VHRLLYVGGLLSCLNNLERATVGASIWSTLCEGLSCSEGAATPNPSMPFGVCHTAKHLHETRTARTASCRRKGSAGRGKVGYMCSPAGERMPHLVFPFWWDWKPGKSRRTYCLLGPWQLCGFSFPMHPEHKGILQKQGPSPYLP